MMNNPNKAFVELFEAEYKVQSCNSRFGSLETLLNRLTKEGWEVVHFVSLQISTTNTDSLYHSDNVQVVARKYVPKRQQNSYE